MPIADRMKLAEGRPLRRRMMAAMAQQDCGQCGYNCHDYSDAIASKSEARLNLCVPGGKETARMLKSLYEEIDKAPAAPSGASGGCPPPRHPRSSAEPGRSRDNPVAGKIRLAPPAEQGRDRKRKPGISISTFPAAASIMSSAIPSAFLPATISAWSTRSSPCSAPRTPPRCSGKTLREVLARRRLAGAGAGYAVRTDLLSSPAARSARRRGRWRRARIPTAMPRRST